MQDSRWCLGRRAAAAAVAAALLLAGVLAGAAVASTTITPRPDFTKMKRVTNADRKAAASRLTAARGAAARLGGPRALFQGPGGVRSLVATLNPLGTPDYFGMTPNYALSPLPLDVAGDFATGTANVVPGTGIRKFVDSLPGLGPSAANDLGQFIPVASPNTTAYPGSDYYVIALVQYTKKLHKDLPATTIRGYVQLDPNTGLRVTAPQYLGPTIVARKGKAVRVKFINKLPTGTGGNLFLPVDTTLMGAGMGPTGQMYTQNRATLHLHGGFTPWISDGTPHQWTTPANENTPYQKGVSVHNVPDMDAGNEPTGTLTFYYTNQQSARLMFYHDHSYGITRLNVYAGEAAPYILQDPVEQALVNGGSFKANGATVTVAAGTIPAEQIPLVIQDKTFVPDDAQLAKQDPTWDKLHWGGKGNLWLPHVYMPNQNPGDPFGINAMGRWDYAFWFYPPLVGIAHGPVPNPLAGIAGEGPQNPGTPNPTIVPEAFMDTPLVNGTAYPYVKVARKAYRFRILNACNDRMLNLQLYFAKSNTATVDASGNPVLQTDSGEVPMVPASGSPTYPATWPNDGRAGGVPDPAAAGPAMIQIGNEGGFLPSATVLPNTPVGYEYFRRTITALNVTNKTLFLGPAERADVVVDFSKVPAGSKLILYNDAPAPVPAFDSRLDYFTGDGDQTSIGGAPDTLPGYGPNTRTVLQFAVGTASAAPQFDLTRLQTGLKAAYAATQDKPIVPQSAYGPAFGTTYPDNIPKLTDTTMSFKPAGQNATVTQTLQEKAIIEGFDMDYGRMNAQLGGTLPNLGPQAGAATPYDYVDAPTDITTMTAVGTQIGQLHDGTQIWRIDHQGVDTHAIHFHLFNVQLIARIAIDGQYFPIDGNEYGWKETIRMNPGQDVIVALRPTAPSLPFKLTDSIRPLDPTRPLGATFTDSLGTVVTNVMTNFGWEYVWHCHLLGHEENDMMRPLVMLASPSAPSNVTASASALSVNAPTVTVRWTNRAIDPAATMFTIQRATDAAFTANVVTFTAGATATSFLDNTVAQSRTYYYRVRAENAVAYSPWSVAARTTTPGRLPLPIMYFRVSVVTNGSISLRWTDPVTGAPRVGLNVQYSTNGGSTWRNAAILGPWATGYTIVGLSHNTTYWMRVIAYNSSGGSPSAIVSARTLP
ncbi:MAG TPA: fibronectin type III domain-containing protein [Coriobacteriia bacterium]|jgi:FtsP/CotA-like multicopper oxidase with cupredoxin domain